MKKEGLSLREAMYKVNTKLHSSQVGLYVPVARSMLNETHDKMIAEISELLEKRFGFTQFEVAVGKSGTPSFLLKVANPHNTANIYLRVSVSERYTDYGRPLHQDILQPFFSRQYQDKRVGFFSFELLVDSPSITMDLNEGEVRQSDLIERTKSLRKDSIIYADILKSDNFCLADDGRVLVLDGGSMSISGYYTRYLSENPHFQALIKTWESFAHLRPFLPQATLAARDGGANDPSAPAPSSLRPLAQHESPHTGHGGLSW
jgi:hypothetical protein